MNYEKFLVVNIILKLGERGIFGWKILPSLMLRCLMHLCIEVYNQVLADECHLTRGAL